MLANRFLVMGVDFDADGVRLLTRFMLNSREFQVVHERDDLGLTEPVGFEVPVGYDRVAVLGDTPWNGGWLTEWGGAHDTPVALFAFSGAGEIISGAPLIADTEGRTLRFAEAPGGELYVFAASADGRPAEVHRFGPGGEARETLALVLPSGVDLSNFGLIVADAALVAWLADTRGGLWAKRLACAPP